MHTLILGCVGCLLIGMAPPPVRSATPGNLGINAAGVAYWSPEIVFVDVFKQAAPWVSNAQGQPWGKGGELALDARGQVTKLALDQYAESMLFVDMAGYYPTGNYTCTFDGDGELTFHEAATITQKSPGKLTVAVDPKKGAIRVRLTRINAENPLRNLKLLLPGVHAEDAANPFAPTFLERFQGFRAVRFMDWGNTNNSKLKSWADRAKADGVTQTGPAGVAIEYQLKLCNVLKADAWLCVPHLADDDYIQQLAKLTKATLSPDRKVYLEFSNETWNGGFQQARDCQTKGLALKLSANAYEAQLRYSSQRSVEIFRLWEAACGDRKRLTRVIAVQSVNLWSGTTELDWQEAHKNADAIAIAPYFGGELGDPKRAPFTATMTLDELFAALKDKEPQAKARDNLRSYAELATAKKLKLLAYESGQHLVGHGGAENNAVLEKLFTAANRDPRMGELYRADLKAWAEAGGELNCVFSSLTRYGKWGSWGLFEWEGEDTAKARAVRELLK